MNRRWHEPLAPAQSAADSIATEFLAAPKRCSASYSGYCGPKVGLDGSRIVTVVGVLVAVREGKRANAPEAHAPVRSLLQSATNGRLG